jgi:hypothetical protein
MSKVILAAVVVSALALSGLHGGRTLAQTQPAKPSTEKTDTKTEAQSESKSKAAEERKAKRAEAKKQRAEKKAKASAARAAVRERQKQCGAEWREAKKAGKLEKNQTWPKFWSACNARLKAKAG